MENVGKYIDIIAPILVIAMFGVIAILYVIQVAKLGERLLTRNKRQAEAMAILKGEAPEVYQSVSDSVNDLPTGVYQVGVDRADPNSEDHSCRVWSKIDKDGNVTIVATEHYR